MEIYTSSYGWPDKFCERGLGIRFTRLNQGTLSLVYTWKYIQVIIGGLITYYKLA
jgi:hypothetical protein